MFRLNDHRKETATVDDTEPSALKKTPRCFTFQNRALTKEVSVLVGLRREFRLLRLALGGLLVAESLRVRLLCSLLLEACDHVLDQALASAYIYEIDSECPCTK